MEQVEHLADNFSDAYGVQIHYQAHRVETTRAVIQLSHGVGEHIGRYTELVTALNAAGYSVWADDHRGHGKTGEVQHGGDLTQIGRLGEGGLRAAIAAIVQFSAVIRKAENPGSRLVYLGHSWGSLMGQIILNRNPKLYDGVVLSGTAYRTPLHMNAGDLNRRFRAEGSPVSWLSRDPLVATEFLEDPYTTTVPLQKLFGLRDAARLLGRPARGLVPNLPLLILVGADDALGGSKSATLLARKYEERSGLLDVAVKVYPGARHEVFNEINRDEVITDLISWLDARFRAR